VLDQLAAQRGLALVCVQPLLVYRAREAEDLTFDKSDPKDAVIIARLTSGLHCYEPERADAVWARLWHLGARRLHLTTDATAAVNQVRGLLECAWPAALDTSPAPFRSATWRAAVAVALERGCGDLARVRRLGIDRFTAAVRRELPRWDATRPCLRIVRAVYAAAADPAGVTAQAVNSSRTIRRHGLCRPRATISRPVSASSRARPSRRVRVRSPPSRSTMTDMAAAHVSDRNGCLGASRLAGHTHSSRARICCS
jgi:hypothetical protein